MNAARFFSSVIRIAVVLCLTVSVSIGLFAGQGQASDDKVIKIGILAPLTGGSSADGEEMVRGAKLAVEELNAAGGVVGYKFKVVVGDTKDQVPDAVVSAFKKITADESVKCMMTGYASPTNFEIELMAEIDMPYLISANSAQTLAIVGENPDKFPTVWSLTPSYDAYETELPRIVEKWAEAGKMTLNNRKVAVVTSDNPYSKTISDGLKETFPTYKWTVTVDEMVPFGEVHDWRAIISKIRKDPPDLIVNTDYQPANEATFVDQFMERPTNSLLFLQYGPSVPEFVELTADRSTGIIYNLLGGAIPTSPVMKRRPRNSTRNTESSPEHTAIRCTGRLCFTPKPWKRWETPIKNWKSAKCWARPTRRSPAAGSNSITRPIWPSRGMITCPLPSTRSGKASGIWFSRISSPTANSSFRPG